MSIEHRMLPVPEAATEDPRSKEMVRAWIAQGALHVSLSVGVWDDAGAWGILLADICRHVANAAAESEGKDREETVRRIRELFDAELDRPTDEPEGRFVE